MAIYATGAAELHHIAGLCRTSRAAPDIAKGMRGARGPIASAVKLSLLGGLPKRNGLNAWAAECKVSVRTRASALSSVTKVKVSKAGHDMQGIDDGLVIAPFYGRSPWHHQAVVGNLISDPIRDEGGRKLRLAVEAAAVVMAERIAHG